MTALLRSGHAVALELTARLEAVRLAAGCETDLGRKVYRGRRSIDETMIPCVAIIEGNDAVTEGDSRRGCEVQTLQEFVLLAYVNATVENPNDGAHAAIRDLKRALFRTAGKPDRTLGGQVKFLHYRGRDVGPRADGGTSVVGSITVAIEYVEDLANP